MYASETLLPVPSDSHGQDDSAIVHRAIRIAANTAKAVAGTTFAFAVAMGAVVGARLVLHGFAQPGTSIAEATLRGLGL